ncbi:cytochrome P450 81C13-like [Malania oleifera]|uniref:cytochrome P450 81C13-like n=1 Tax=Malania oleifera TaxID=397392 RepID=UPI0025AEBCBC|nr:cytochrome P450 81C13-like [Malania oleifera]
MDVVYCYLALFFAVLLVLRLQFVRCRVLPPSPLALPIIGHLHLIKKPLHEALEKLSLRYGPILYLRFGVQSIVVVSSPSAVEECFTKNDIIFANRPRSLVGDILTYDYTALVFAPYGHLWRSLRRLTVVEIFSSNSLQKLSTIREEEVCNLLRLLYEVSNSGCQKVDLKFTFSLLAFNVIMKIVAGKRCVEGDAASVEMGRKHLQELKETFLPNVSMNMCDFLPILRWVGYKGLEKNMVKLHKRRDEFLQSLIDDLRRKKTTHSSFNATPNVERGKILLIETLLSLQESEPDFYSDDVIKSIMLLMFIAGIDTSGITLQWAMSLLLNHPQVLQKVRAEIDNHVEPERLIGDTDLSKLPYLRCIVYETLRLYPTVPLLLPHFSSNDCTLGGYDIPRETVLLVNAWALHRDPKIWDDPNKFMPERFEATEGEKEMFKFVPFGVGRRACPGASMAIRTISLALGALIQCFEWERVGLEMDMGYDFTLTLAMVEPLEAVCTPRKNLLKLLSQL